MTAAPVVRIVATNDFCGRVDPERASFGTLPGLAGLRATVDDIRRDSDACLWLDAGDFAGWSPLASLTDGDAAFAAAADLPFDAASPGNHELDWGLAKFQQFADTARYPLVCANAGLGLPSSVTLATTAGPVGVIGLTVPGLKPADDATPRPIPGLAAALRAQGCVLVVAVIHDGVDWYPGHTMIADPSRFGEIHGEWLDAVDVVIAGHTLSRWAAPLPSCSATPVIQPWAFGAEVAVVDVPLAEPTAARTRFVRPSAGPAYVGTGAYELREAAHTEHGELKTAAANVAGGTATLARMLAHAMRVVAFADAALLPAPYCSTQPALDGVFGWLGAGPVTELDLHRLAPYPDHILTATVTRQDWHIVRAIFTPVGLPEASAIRPKGAWWDHYPLAPGLSQRAQPPDPLTLATIAPFAELMGSVLGRELVWTDTGHSLKAATAELVRTLTPLDPRRLT